MGAKKLFGTYTKITAIIVLVLCLTLPLSTFAAGTDNTVDGEENFSLTIMHMNDTHAHVEEYPKMVTAIKDIRNEDPDALLFNAGDVFSGTLYFNEFQGKADLALFNLMGVNAMVFGNHEFDLGDKENGHKSLFEFVKDANFPFLGTNIDFTGDSDMNGLVSGEKITDNAENGKIYDGIIMEVNGEKIGVFGLTTEDTADIASPVNVDFSDYQKSARNTVAAFKEKGINKIIAVNHIGYDSNPTVGNDLELAKQVDGIDVIVGGHSHTKLAKPTVIDKDANGKKKDPTVIVQAYQYSEYLGKLVVEFDEKGVIVGHNGELIELAGKEDDEEAAQVLHEYKDKVDRLMNEETGAVAQKDLPNPRLGEDSDVSVRANETELGNLVTDAMLAKAQEKFSDVVIAMQNGGGIRAPIEKGPITVGEVISVLPFGNDPVIVNLKGAEIKDALEHSVSLAPLEHGGFLHVSGMQFTYDSTKEPGSRVMTMEVEQDGKLTPIELDQEYLITTNNFTGKGGDGFDVFAKAYADGRVMDIGEIDWEQLRDYMVEDLDGVVDPDIEGRIVDLKGEKPKDPNPPKDDDDDDDGNGGDGKGPGDGDGNQNGKGPGNKDDDKKQPPGNDDSRPNHDDKNKYMGGQKLPKTATNMYTMMLIGVLLLLVGGGLMSYRTWIKKLTR